MNIKLNPTEWAYLAGLIDGEGSIIISKQQRKGSRSPTYQAQLDIKMGDDALPMMQEFHREIGGWLGLDKYAQRRYKHPFWNWRMGSIRLLRVLESVEPFIRVKTRQVRLAIGFLRHKELWKHPSRGHGVQARGRYPMPESELAWREAARQKMSSYNRKGPRLDWNKEPVLAII